MNASTLASTATAPDTEQSATPGPCPDTAIDNLRAARLRRELAREGSSVFVYAPRPGTPLPGSPNRIVFGVTNAAQVSRASFAANALLTLQGQYVVGSPEQLRDLAERLIDAAHNIEAHPASSLVAAQESA